MTWKEELNNILIEYDFNKDAPGTFDFVEAEKKLTALIERLLKKQRMECFQSLIKAKLPEGYMSVPEWNYSKMNQVQVRDYILNAPEPVK